MEILRQFLIQIQQFLEQWHRRIAAVAAICALCTYVLGREFDDKHILFLYYAELIASLLTGHMFWPLTLITISLMFKLSMLVALVSRQVRFSFPLFTGFRLRYRKRLYSSFIVRRLLMQVEMAMQRMPKGLSLDDPMVHQLYLEAKEAAYTAVDEFRRDATNLLFDEMPETLEESPYFVLDEEEQQLCNAGYGRINLRVTKDVLYKLLYPERVE